MENETSLLLQLTGRPWNLGAGIFVADIQKPLEIYCANSETKFGCSDHLIHNIQKLKNVGKKYWRFRSQPRLDSYLFFLFFQSPSTELVSFPSLLSHITSMHLNYELLVMPVTNEKGGSPALKSFLPLSATLPCDIHILNLRTLQAEVCMDKNLL